MMPATAGQCTSLAQLGPRDQRRGKTSYPTGEKPATAMPPQAGMRHPSKHRGRPVADQPGCGTAPMSRNLRLVELLRAAGKRHGRSPEACYERLIRPR
jgi:hypothetical protein